MFLALFCSVSDQLWIHFLLVFFLFADQHLWFALYNEPDQGATHVSPGLQG